MKIFYNPECSKCQAALNAVCEMGENPEIVEYLKDVPTKEELKEIISMLGIRPFELIRTGEEIFQKEFEGKELSDEEWFDAMIKNPVLIQRPIIVKGNKAVIGRTEERIKEILG